MAYAKFPESFFNNIAESLYSAGPFQFELPQMNMIVNGVLSTLGLHQGLLQLELNKAPVVRICRTGVSLSIDARARSLKPTGRHRLPVTCQLMIKVDVKGNRLILVSNSAKCKMKPEVFKGKIVRKMAEFGLEKVIVGKLEKLFDTGVFIPQPGGLRITQGSIDYQDGYLVVRGNLNLLPDVIQKVLRRFNKKKT